MEQNNMKGWILKKNIGEIKPDWHEMNRFICVARDMNIELEFLSPKQMDIVVDPDDRKSVLIDGKVVDLPNFIIPRMGAGTDYYATAVIRHLENLGVYSVNNSVAINTVKDKLFTSQLLAASNLPIPKTMLTKPPLSSKIVNDRIGFPVVIKTISGSKGNGVFLAKDKNEFKDICGFITEINSEATILCQEYIGENVGVDIRVIVIGGRVIKCMKRIAASGDFKANFSRGGTVEPYPIDEELERISLEATKILGLDIAGVDLLIDKDGYKICEVNSSPGFNGMEQANPDVDIANEIFKFIRFKLAGV
jgi:gamma-F420-2:alpha-L-glutamate ligase